MIRRWFRKHLPSEASFERNRWVRPFKRMLSHPSIWGLNRRSVAGGVAAGLFCGLIPGPLQVFGSVIWAILGRVNLPVAAFVTLYTNPLTIIPLYLLAVRYGNFLLGELNPHAVANTPVLPAWDWLAMGQSIHAMWDWMLSLGPSLAVGLPALMATLSFVGYVLTRLAWSVGLRLAWANRKRKRLANLGN